MDGPAELVVAATEGLAIQGCRAELFGRDRDEMADPGREGGLEAGHVEQGEQVAEGAGGGWLAEEAQGVEQFGGLVSGPLGDSGVGGLTAQNRGAGRGEEGDQGESPTVQAAWVGDVGQMGEKAARGKGGHESSSRIGGLSLHAHSALLTQGQSLSRPEAWSMLVLLDRKSDSREPR